MVRRKEAVAGGLALVTRLLDLQTRDDLLAFGQFTLRTSRVKVGAWLASILRAAAGVEACVSRTLRNDRASQTVNSQGDL